MPKTYPVNVPQESNKTAYIKIFDYNFLLVFCNFYEIVLTDY